jgi:DNA-binding SARP family transcriptional activator/TolB-like protein
MLTIRLLGGATLEGPDGPLTGPTVPRARLALVALVATNPARSISRERAMAMLWPESDTPRARHLLRDTIYRLREMLADAALRSVGDELRLDPARIRCDVWEFEDAAPNDPDRADRLYKGPFLDGVFLSDSPEFERWVDTERARLGVLHARVLESIAMKRCQRGEWPAAVDAWQRLAAVEPGDARIALLLMQALDAAGNRAAAIRHADSHTALLASEIGAAPDPEVMAFAEELRRATGRRQEMVIPRTGVAESIVATPATVPSARKPRARIVLGSAAALLLLAAATLTWIRRGVASPDPASITVLPADNSGADTSAAYIAQGMADGITQILASNPGLTVKSSRSALAAREYVAPLREIARRLGVANVLVVGVRRDGERLRVVANLTRAADGKVLWSDRYDREARDPFLVQDQIAHAISIALRTRLASEARTRQASFGTTDPEAYDFDLQGRYYLGRRGSANLRLALDNFQRAVAKDPQFARAHAGLSATATLLTLYERPAFSRDSMLPLALVEAQRAISLDSSLSDAHAALGQALTYLGRRREAELAYRKAVALDPRNATAHQWFAELLIAEGRVDEATAEMELSLQSDPLSAINFAVACNHFRLAGRYEEALRFGKRAVELNPAIPAIWQFYARALFFAGLRDSAERISARHSPRHVMYAYIRARNGNHAVADSVKRASHRWNEGAAPVDGTVSLAVLHLAAGNGTGALDVLERAARNPAFPLHNSLVDQIYDPIRDSTRFRTIVRNAGLDETLNLQPRRRR